MRFITIFKEHFGYSQRLDLLHNLFYKIKMSCSLLNFKCGNFKNFTLLLSIEAGGRKLTSKKERAKSKVDKKVESDKR